MNGSFIVFEGIDGCGKTTQIKELTKWLPKSGLLPSRSNLLITREPGGTALGKYLRKLLLHPQQETAPEAISELLLYAADRAQHVSKVIIPALKKGDWVISDRFSGSTLAYQGYGRNLDLNLINQLESISTQGIIPDITFWFDLSIKNSLKRREKETNDRIEEEGAEFLAKVSHGFKHLAKERKWIRIPAEQEKNFISERIQEVLINFNHLKYNANV